jgi:hypothetical protein
MIAVLQDRFYDPDAPAERSRGNCLQAALASVLDLPLGEVPHFVQDEHDHPGDPEWDHWTRMCEWLRKRGLHPISTDPTGLLPGEYAMTSGLSPRGNGIHHIVIYRDGRLAHDPHPDGTGLRQVLAVYAIRPIKQPSSNRQANHQCTCPGLISASGVDTAPDGPDKVWRCDECGLNVKVTT